mgnify:CR=1 FL=1
MGTHQGDGQSQDARRHEQDAAHHEGVDAEYGRWRDQHVQQLDADYDSWKRERQGQSFADFHDWRKQRA